LNTRAWVCTIVAALALFVLIGFTPKQVFLPKGIVLPAEKVFPAISADSVTIYTQAPDVSMTRLGMVRAEVEFNTLTPQTKEQLFQKVKTMAASIGANGVVINLLVPDDRVRHMLTFIGTAVYIPASTPRSAK
jgi:hypothetical protein